MPCVRLCIYQVRVAELLHSAITRVAKDAA